MKLKNKLILIFISIIIIYSAISQLIVKYYILPSSVNLGEFYALNDFERCLISIEDSGKRFENNAADWANWQPTYDFMEKKNVDRYISTNLGYESFRNVSLDLIMYFDKDGKLYWGKILKDTGRELFDAEAASDTTKTIIRKYSSLLNHTSPGHNATFGIISTPSEAFIIGTSPIHKNDDPQYCLGTLIMGKKISPSLISYLSGRVLVKFQLIPLGIETEKQYTDTIKALESCSTFFDYKNSTDEILYLYTYLKDVNKAPVMLLKARLDRHIFHDTYSTLHYFMQIMLALGLVFLLILLLIFQYIVIKPVRTLTDNIIKIKKDWRAAIGFSTKKDDEIGILVNHIREMQHTISEHRENLESLVAQKTGEVIQSRKETIIRLAAAAEKKDNETGAHIERLEHLCAMLAGMAGLNEHDSGLIGLASILHDIGKIGIPDYILKKPGKLTADEMEIIKTHPVIGKHILEGSTHDLLKVAEDISLCHHERWNGTGYPKGLVGENIPFSARIVAIIDVFDALLSKRVYKEAVESEKVKKFFEESKGVEFDPTLTEILLANFQKFIDVRKATGKDE